MSTVEIMKEFNMITIHHLLINESLQFIHKILFNGGPKVIYNLFTFSLSNNTNICGVRKPMMAKSHKSNNVYQLSF